MANAVLPMLGRAAMTIISAACSPLVIRSNSTNPVGKPVTEPRCLIQFFDLFDCLHDQIFGRNNFGFDVFSGDRKNLFFSFIQQRFDFPLLIVALSRKPVAGGDQPAQDILLADDIDVVARVGGGGNKVVKIAQKFRSADLFQLISIFESLLERDEVDWFALVAELEHQAIDDLVRRNVECLRPKVENANVGYLPRRKQQGTKDSLFPIFAEWQRARNLPRCE